MERLVVVWCPSLLDEGGRGEEACRFLEVLDAVEAFCPWVEPVALGVCALPARGPSRFFGGEPVVVEKLVRALREVLAGEEPARVGVADGLFAAVLAARSETVVAPGGTAGFVAPWSVAVLRRPELAVTLARLGVRTLGQFADLPVPHVLSRFGADAGACHRVARGEEGELVGVRDPSIGRRLQVVRGDAPDPPRQPGFFGGATAVDARAARSLAGLQHRFGHQAVVVGRVHGGRGPSERARLVPWGSQGTDPAAGSAPGPGEDAPWPGRLPPPSPATVFCAPLPADVVDATTSAVRITGRSLLTAEPDRVSIGGDRWQAVTAWAGPYPVTDRWWSTRRRRARMQVVTEGGAAFLLVAERGRWWVEAAYD
ncbi:MAG TPA: hypothetical protein VKG43_04965 [Acidimicrobiales bacterium]|nr:hypothetical protein [Acidimicrobiales bacterium]